MKINVLSPLNVLSNYYSSLINIWIFKRKLSTRMDLCIWSIKHCLKLLDKKVSVDGYETFSDWILASNSASYNLSKLIMKIRFLGLPVLILWPFFAILLAYKRRQWGFVLQWKVTVYRLDLFFCDTRGPYSEKDMDSTLSTMPNLVYTIYRFNYLGGAQLDFTNKNTFYKKAKESDLAVVENLNEKKLFDLKYNSPDTKILVKPENDSQGNGISIILARDLNESLIDSKKTVYQVLLKNIPLIENIVSSEAALCTLRVITCFIGNKIEVLGTVFKLARKNTIVDNMHCGGIGVLVNEQGVLLGGVTEEQELTQWNKVGSMNAHPDTGVIFTGVKLPFYEEAKNLCCSAHQKLASDVFLLGFDVALTETGPLLLEANDCSGFLELLINHPNHTAYWEELIHRVNSLP